MQRLHLSKCLAQGLARFGQHIAAYQAVDCGEAVTQYGAQDGGVFVKNFHRLGIVVVEQGL